MVRRKRHPGRECVSLPGCWSHLVSAGLPQHRELSPHSGPPDERPLRCESRLLQDRRWLAEMQKRGMQICLSDIPAVAVVSLASFIYVSVTPYSSQLYNVLDVPRLKADSFNHRYREILGSPSIVLLTGLCALMVLFLWSGIFRFVLHFDRNSADVLVLYPLILGLSMIALAAGPEAVDFRLRVPSIPFLAIVAAVGWFRDRRSPVRIPS